MLVNIKVTKNKNNHLYLKQNGLGFTGVQTKLSEARKISD